MNQAWLDMLVSRGMGDESAAEAIHRASATIMGRRAAVQGERLGAVLNRHADTAFDAFVGRLETEGRG